MRSLSIAGVMLLLASSAFAQDAPAPAAASSAASTMQYSAEERAAGLREGRGMGLAMPAETNGYPGPRHVLEVAEDLDLTADQRRRTQRLFDDMRAEASQLGEQLLAQEAELDAIFRERRANAPVLEASARRIGETEAALKVTHLRTHLAMMEVLTPAQVARYVELRRAGAGSGRTRPEPAASDEHRH